MLLPRSDLVLAGVDHDPSVRVRLVTFSHAGAGAAPFLSWKARLLEGISLCATRRPGREARFNDPPLRTISSMAEEAAGALLALPPRPMVLFGHSLGAMVAYEVARTLQARGAAPLLLAVSAKPAPGVPSRDRPLARLPDAHFLRELERRYGAYPGQSTASRELLHLMLPALRADIEASEKHRSPPGPRLRCPIWACYGSEDETVGAESVRSWAEVTESDTDVSTFPGGHFYLFDPALDFIGTLLARLGPLPF